MLLRFIQVMQKGVVKNKEKEVVFKKRPGFILGRGEREVLSMLEVKAKELVEVQKEKRVQYSRDMSKVQKDGEVKRVGGELEGCVLDVLLEMIGIGLQGDSRKSVFIYRLACLGLNLKSGS